MSRFERGGAWWGLQLGAALVWASLGCGGGADAVTRPGEGIDPDQPGAQQPGTATPGAGSPAAPPGAAAVTADPCTTPEQAFGWEVYGSVFSRCAGCHNGFGLARQVGVPLRLALPGEPDFERKNVEVLRPYAASKVDVGGESFPLLLAKPTARVGHVGGQVLAPDGPEAKLLAGFVAKLVSPTTCQKPPPDAAAEALAGLTLASPKATYARAKLSLTGEVATPEELTGFADTDNALDEKLDALMQSDAFLVRVKEMYNDWLLTDSYSSLVRGEDLLPQLRDYPQRSYFQPLCTPERDFRCCDTATQACCSTVESDPSVCTEAANDLAIDAIAREPLALLAHVVKNDLPLTELLTADYTMVNPYSATMYGLPPAQRQALFDTDRANDADEWKPVQLLATGQNSLRLPGNGAYPHAGVLSMPVTLVRYPSSTSNQQRTRAARLILERMLAVPVMKLADFSTATLPADADLELATQEYTACTVCHAAIDPIAGHFKNFGSNGQFRSNGRGRLADHLPDPEFLDETAADGDDPLRWLATQVAQHERFGLGVLMPALADLSGAEILTPPNDTSAQDYAPRYLAFRLQQLEIQRLRRELVGSAGLRLKPLIKAIVKGPFFRAIGAAVSDPTMRDALALAGVGVGALLTPEQLARKVESVSGISYRQGLAPTGRDLLRSFRDYRLMFGGTDWDTTPARYREPNAMSVRIAMRMGNEVACAAVPQDFSIIDPSARKLFRHVDLTTTPEGGGEALIKQEIKRLHLLLLGEDLADSDPELEATYQLWAQSHEALRTSSGGRQNSGGGNRRVSCRAVASFTPEQTPYPTDTHRVIEGDPNNTVRPWVAVLAYLVSDGRFFLQ
ncbi:MAG: DUF1592 domain-containing protein [Polyangiales bacterium]